MVLYAAELVARYEAAVADRTLAKKRKIDGKVLYLVSHAHTKESAKLIARDYRAIGFASRIVFGKRKPAAYRYSVYVRLRK